jgi:hypothetical protein
MSLPTTEAEALESLSWKGAMASHLGLLDARGAWEAVESVPAGVVPYGYSWHFDDDGDEDDDEDEDEDGEYESGEVTCSADLVLVPPGRDAPRRPPPSMVPLSVFRTLRVLLAASAPRHLWYLRVTRAHLAGTKLPPTAEVYLTPPGRGPHRVLRPLRGLTGISIEEFATETLADALEEMDFTPTTTEGLYTRPSAGGIIALLSYPDTARTGAHWVLASPSLLHATDVLVDAQFVLGAAVRQRGFPRDLLGLAATHHHASRQIWLRTPLAGMRHEYPRASLLTRYSPPLPGALAPADKVRKRYGMLARILVRVSALTRPDISLWAAALASRPPAEVSAEDAASALALVAYLSRTRARTLSFGGKHDAAPADPAVLTAYACKGDLPYGGHLVRALGCAVAWGSPVASAEETVRAARDDALAVAEVLRALGVPVADDQIKLYASWSNGDVGSLAGPAAPLVLSRARSYDASVAPDAQHAEFFARAPDGSPEDTRAYHFWAVQLGVGLPRPAGWNLARLEARGEEEWVEGRIDELD